MTFTLTTAIREIIRASHAMHPYEGHHLTTEGFKLEAGVWVRRSYLEPVDFDLVFMVQRREIWSENSVLKEADKGEKTLASQDDPR